MTSLIRNTFVLKEHLFAAQQGVNMITEYFIKNQKLLNNYARRLCSFNKETAEDLTQELYYNLIKYKYEPKSNREFLNLAYKIIRGSSCERRINLTIDGKEIKDDFSIEAAVNHETPESLYSQLEDSLVISNKLDKALKLLNDQEKTLVNTFANDTPLTSLDISSYGMLKINRNKAMTKLRKLMRNT